MDKVFSHARAAALAAKAAFFRGCKLEKLSAVLGIIIFIFISAVTLPAQEILTASDFFDQVSATYQQITDYQAGFIITQEDTVMAGRLYHKRPNYLLLEFSEPEGQIIAVDGEKLTIYIPYLNVVMEQQLNKRAIPLAPLVTDVTGKGLELMMSRYSVAYLDSQDPVNLDEENMEQVRKLLLEWRSIDEGFRQLTMSIGTNMLIRRIVGVTTGFEEIQLDLINMLVDQNIPEGKFRFEAPSSANTIYNFIFDPEE